MVGEAGWKRFLCLLFEASRLRHNLLDNMDVIPYSYRSCILKQASGPIWRKDTQPSIR